MTRPTTTGKAQDLITFTRSTTGTYLDSVTYGNELVTNGDFATDSDWTVSSAWDISAGVATATNADGSYSTSSLRQSLSLELGKLYKVSVDASSITGQVRLYQGLFSSGLQVTGAGVVTGFLTGEGSGNLNLLATAGSSAVIDSVSVKEVIGGQGTQGTPLLRTSAINEARIEYDASGNCLGLLVEEAKTNRVTYSEDFGNGAWSKQSASIATNTTVSPDGTLTGDKLIGNNATVNTEKFTNRSIYSYVGQTVTGSVYLKKAEYTWVQVNLYNSGAYSNRVWVNLDTGAVGTNLSSIPVTVTLAGDSWYRVALTATVQATGLAFLTVALADADGDLYTNVGDQSSGAYLWGAQLETGSFPTSYIPTSGSTVTRAADVASLAVSEFGYNQDQGSVVVNYDAKYNSFSTRIVELQSDTNNRMTLYIGQDNASVALFIRASSSNQGSPATTNVAQVGLDKVAFSVASNSANICLNGGTVGVSTSVTVPSVTSLLIGDSNAAGYLNGHIKSVQYYPLRLSNAQLQALTV